MHAATRYESTLTNQMGTIMTKITKSILSSLLLTGALAPPACATPHHFAHLRGHLGARVSDPDLYPGPVRVKQHNASAKMSSKRPALLDPTFTIIDHPDAGNAPGQGT